jgi:hypothetical protein
VGTPGDTHRRAAELDTETLGQRRRSLGWLSSSPKLLALDAQNGQYALPIVEQLSKGASQCNSAETA